MSDGTIKFDTRVDSSGFDQSMSQLERKSSTVGDFIKGQLGTDLIKQAAGAIVDFSKKAITLASDLEEVQNVVDVTFEDSADKIQSFADTASQQFGLTELQVKQFSGTFGAMVKSMGLSTDAAADMALDMTALTADMASFYNLDHQTAFEKLRSGLSGETEPLKQLGINMSVANLEAFALAQGIETAYDKMSEAERVQLRYNYIMDATSDSQGDFARTSDGFANQLRLLSNNIDTLTANIGAALLPAATVGLQAINSLFAVGSEGNQTLAEINSLSDAINGENGLKKQIDDIRADFANNAIQIRVDYSNAQTALDEYKLLIDDFRGDGEYSGINLKVGMDGEEITKLQTDLRELGYEISDSEIGTFGSDTQAAVLAFQEANNLTIDGIAGVQTQAALIAQTSAALQETVAQLVTLYPELQQYVGDNGLFTIEAEEVQGLIDKYTELAKAKAYATMLSDYENAYYTAEGNYEVLVTKRDMTQESLDQSKKTYISQSDLGNTAGKVIEEVNRNEMFGDYLNIDTAQKVSDYIRQYMDFYGALTGNALNGVNLSEIENSAALFDASGNIIDVANMTAEQYDTLLSLMDALNSANTESMMSSQGEMEDYITAVNAANDAVAESQKTLSTAQAEYSVMAETYNRMFADTGETVATTIGKSILDNVDSAKIDINSYFDQLQTLINSRNSGLISSLNPGIYSRSNASARGHATGLDYVPYNGYRATLHVGERVLTAAENRAYTQGGSGIDIGALAAVLQSAQTKSDIVVTVDGHELARYMADSNRSALSDRAKRLAKGRGL